MIRHFLSFLSSYQRGIKAGDFYEEPVGDDFAYPDWEAMHYSDAMFIFAPTIGLVIFFVLMNIVITRVFTKNRDRR